MNSIQLFSRGLHQRLIASLPPGSGVVAADSPASEFNLALRGLPRGDICVYRFLPLALQPLVPSFNWPIGGNSPWLDEALVVPTLLGSVNARGAGRGHPLLLAHPPQIHASWRQRALDDFLAGSKVLALVRLAGDGGQLGEVFAGMGGVLSLQRPMLSLMIEGGGSGLGEELRDAGYLAVDCRGDFIDPRQAQKTEILAFHWRAAAERIALFLPPRTDPEARLDAIEFRRLLESAQGQAETAALWQTCLGRAWQTDPRPPVLDPLYERPERPSHTWEISTLPAWGFWKVERAPYGEWAWMGPGINGGVLVPLPRRPGHYRLRLNMLNGLVDLDKELNVSVSGGAVVLERTTGVGFVELRLHTHNGLPPYLGCTAIEFRCAKSGDLPDGRKANICLAKAIVTSESVA